MGCMVFPKVNKIGRPKAITSIPILLGNYKQLLPKDKNRDRELRDNKLDSNEIRGRGKEIKAGRFTSDLQEHYTLTD